MYGEVKQEEMAMFGNNTAVASIMLMFGVVLLGIVIAFIRVYWFGKGLPDEQAEKRPGRVWLDSRKKQKTPPAGQKPAGAKKPGSKKKRKR